MLVSVLLFMFTLVESPNFLYMANRNSTTFDKWYKRYYIYIGITSTVAKDWKQNCTKRIIVFLYASYNAAAHFCSLGVGGIFSLFLALICYTLLFARSSTFLGLQFQFRIISKAAYISQSKPL